MPKLTTLNRQELAQFATSQQQIRFFEQLTGIIDGMPSLLVDIQTSADAALIAAQQALAKYQELASLVVLPDVVAPVSLPGPQGWASYADTDYTSGSPLTVLDGVATAIPNNAGATVSNYLPPGSEGLYDGSLITPMSVGDYYLVTVRMVVEPSVASMSVDFGIDVIGTLLGKQTQPIISGIGLPQSLEFVTPISALALFVDNGGAVTITPQGGDLDIYDIEYQIVRIYAYT